MLFEYLKSLGHKWKVLFKDRAFVISFLIGSIVHVGAWVAHRSVSAYNDMVSYPPVGDAILDRIPVYDLEILFVWGFYFLVVCMFAYGFLVRPETVPVALKTFGVLILVRLAFIGLTHIGPPERNSGERRSHCCCGL